MSQLTLFTDLRFPCPQRLQLVVLELGLEMRDIRRIDIAKYEQQSNEYLAINPFGAVPCLQDHSCEPALVLTESRAIARYLARKYGGASDTPESLVEMHVPLRLIPDEEAAQAKFEEAASVEITSFDAAANPLAFEAYFKPTFLKQNPREDVVEELKSRLQRTLGLLDRKLSGQPFMAGEKLTLVDLFYVPYMHQMEVNVWSTFLDEHKYLQAWWSRMKSRESYQQIYQDREGSLNHV